MSSYTNNSGLRPVQPVNSILNYSTGNVLNPDGGSSSTDPAISKDPVAQPYSPQGVTYAYPNYPGNVMYAGGAQNPPLTTVYVGNQGGPANMSPPLMSAPTGRWKDGLFDCCSNLWPSCGCLFIFSGVWLVGQMAEKTQFSSFRNIVNLYFGLYIFCFLLSLFIGGWVMLLPFILVWIIAIRLRLHVSGHYNIRGGCFQEFLTAFFCAPCSVTQLARHIYGYQKVYDGDSDPLVADYYIQGGNRYAQQGSSGSHMHGNSDVGGFYGSQPQQQQQTVIRNQGSMMV